MATMEREIDYDPLRGEEEEEEDYDENTKLINREKNRDFEISRPPIVGESSHINPTFDPYGGIARSKIEITTDLALEKRLYDLKYYDPKEKELLSKLNDINRGEFKDKYYPKMSASVEVGQTESGGLASRLFGETKWTPLFTKKGEFYKKMTKPLKNALGPNRDAIIIENDEKIESKTKRIEELELQELRTDISPEVRDTITNEINVKKEEVAVLNEENVLIK